MLTSRLLGVPSVLVALASLAPLTHAHADVVTPRGSGSGALVLPEVTQGEMRGTLFRVSGEPIYLLRAQLEAFDVLVPGSRIGSLEGRLFDARSARLVGTLHGMWDEEGGMGRFEAHVRPVGVPDPHHFVVGYLRGSFELDEEVPLPEELIVQPPKSAAERSAAIRPRLRAEAMGPVLASHRLDAALGFATAMSGPRVGAQRATAPRGGDAGRFDLQWWIDGLN